MICFHPSLAHFTISTWLALLWPKVSLLFFNLAHTLPSVALPLQGSLACHALQQLFSESPLKSQLLTPPV